MSTEEEETHLTPVTIVTGFLGSGKTTLVNYILKEQSDWKICIVENEFGEVPIDNELVEENLAAKEDIITMDNGCVCCSVRGDLVRTFYTLINRRKTFDAIIIETTGLADPAPIVFTFNTNPSLQENYRIDSIVCLVDVKHVSVHLDDVKPDGNINEAENQIAFSDRIIMNKLDLLTEEEVEDVEDRIRSINSFAKIVKTKYSRAPLDQILGLNSFSLEKMVEIDPTIMEEDDEEDDGHVHDEHCNHGHDCGLDHDHGHNHSGCTEDHAHDDCKGHDHGHDHHGSGCTEDHSHDDHCNGHEHKHEHKEHAHEHEHKEQCTHEHEHKEHGHGHEHKSHDHGHEHTEKKQKKKKTHNLSLVSSVGFTIEGPLDVPKFNSFMSDLLTEKAKDLYRTKGVLSFADQGDTKFVFQGVHEQINFGPADKPWGADEVRVSKMVFIGKNLDYEFLKTNLKNCCVDPEAAHIHMHKRA